MEANKQKKWLFIDCDNTLMGTEILTVPSLVARFNELYAAQTGRELTVSEFQQHFHGQGRQTLCQNLGRHFNIQVDFEILYDQREWRMMQALQANGVEMAPHLIETLSMLQNDGFSFCFVSNNPIQRGLAAMRYSRNGQGDKLAQFFGTNFFEATDIQKPSPAVYLRALEQTGARRETSFAVEDSATGVKAAVAAGLTTIAYLGFCPPDTKERETEKLLSLGAKFCVDDWCKIPNLIKQENCVNS